MEPSKGRGRGVAQMLEALKRSQMMDSPPASEEPSPQTTPGPSEAPSAAPSVVSSAIGGRGRINLMLSQMQQRPGEPIIRPASDVSPTMTPGPPRGVGRGLKLLENLKTKTSAPSPAASSVAAVTEKMSEASISTKATSVGKSKYYREVKETPPVVMKGQAGTPCEVTANYVRLNFKENCVFEYEVKYKPDQDHRHLRFKLLNEHRDLFKEKTFDGTTLYVPHQLEKDVTRLTSTNPYDDSKVQLEIIFRRTRRLSEMVHLYNVLFNNIMSDLSLVRFGRQHYSQHAAVQIPQFKLEVWPGYVTAVNEYEGGLMLTLDSTHRVLRTQTVLSLIQETVQRCGSGWKKEMGDILIGSSVMTTYNKKLFRVDCIDDTMSPKSTFEKKEGDKVIQISYIDYYKKNYGIDIMDWEQPILISRESKTMPGSEQKTEFMICLIPELCQLTGLTDDLRNNFRLMKEVATYTRVLPAQRHAAFKTFIRNVLENDKARSRLEGWGLSLHPETVNITARTLPPENIMFGNDIRVPGKPNADWNGEVSRHPVIQAVDLFRWVVLYTKRDQQVTNDFVDTLLRCSKPMGITVNKPNMVLLPTDRTDAYVGALKKCITNSLQLVVAIAPNAKDDRYSAIKKICCVDYPVPSQVINSRTIMNQAKLRAITQKILLQINCKLGGTLWGIAIPVKTAMIVGIDSYHDASRKHRSVCSFIASFNPTMTHWYSRAVFQEKGQEIADGLRSCLVDALKHYLNVNGTLPDKIIMYRDGVGDGQLNVVKEYEIPQMKVQFTTLQAKYNPSLTYMVVQKRINTRIFMKARGLENPHPGTVVDHDITRRDWYDFLIVSQKVNQGTVTPTHYVVVHDDSGFTPDQCQRLTYKMCHLYYNWPGTVRVPAPCQYAHKLAYLVGQNIHQQPSEKLSDKLYFL